MRSRITVHRRPPAAHQGTNQGSEQNLHAARAARAPANARLSSGRSTSPPQRKTVVGQHLRLRELPIPESVEQGFHIATDRHNRFYTALPDIGHVVRIDSDGSQHVVDRSAGGWRVTAVATFGDSVFLLESSDSTNAGQRVRVIRDSGGSGVVGPDRALSPNVEAIRRKTNPHSVGCDVRIIRSIAKPRVAISLASADKAAHRVEGCDSGPRDNRDSEHRPPHIHSHRLAVHRSGKAGTPILHRTLGVITYSHGVESAKAGSPQ